MEEGSGLLLRVMTILALGMWFVTLIVLVSVDVLLPHVRHDIVDNRMMQAWFVNLPGWETVYYPEQNIDLSSWVGSRGSLTVKVNGEENEEVNAGLTLKLMGLYSDYDFQQREEHWVLHRDASTKRYFTLGAYYRVSPWKPSSG